MSYDEYVNYEDDMYGWLELGGATTGDPSFYNSTTQDVVLRTTTLDSMLILGNSNAVVPALYIKDNMIGLATIPNTLLDINGDCHTNGVHNWSTNANCNLLTSNITFGIEINASNIVFNASGNTSLYGSNHFINQKTRTMELDTLGVLRNRMVISDSIKVPGEKIDNVYIQSFYTNIDDDVIESGYTIVTGIEYADKFFKDDIFIIEHSKFQVLGKNVDVNCNLVLNVNSYIPEQNFTPLPIASDSYVNIELLQSIDPILPTTFSNLIDNEILRQTISFTQFTYSASNTMLTLNAAVNDQNNTFFNVGTMYHIKTIHTQNTIASVPDNLVRLENKTPVLHPGDISKLNLTFRSIDPLASIIPYTAAITSRLQSANEVSCVLYPVDAPIPFGQHTPVTLPINITQVIEVTPTSVTYKITTSAQNDLLFNYLFNHQYQPNYLGNFAYIEDAAKEVSRIWVVDDFLFESSESGVITLTTSENISAPDVQNILNQTRGVRILPFRYSAFNRIGDSVNTCYIPSGTKLAISSVQCSETLTIGGSASVRDHFFIYSPSSATPFHINYESNVLRFNMQNTISTHYNKDPYGYCNQTFIHLHNSNDINSFKEDLLINAKPLFSRGMYISQDLLEPNRHGFRLDGNNIEAVVDDITNTSLSKYGSLYTKNIGCKDVKTEMFTLSNVEIVEIINDVIFQDANHRTTSGSVIKIDATLQARIRAQDIIKVKNSLFTVVKTHISNDDSDYRYAYLSLEWYFAQEKSAHGVQPLLNNAEICDITIFRGAFTRLDTITHIPMKLLNYGFITDDVNVHTEMSLTGTIDVEQIIFLSIGRFYNFKAMGYISENDQYYIENVLILQSIVQLGPNNVTLRFKSIDNKSNISTETNIGNLLSNITVGADNGYIYIYPLNSFFQPNNRQFPFGQHKLSVYPYTKVTESNVDISFSAEANSRTYINIKNSVHLAKYISINSEFQVSPIDRLITDFGVYDLSGVYHTTEHVRAAAKYVNTNYLQAYNNGSIAFAFNGIPLHVYKSQYPPDEQSVIYFIEDVDVELYNLMLLYVGHTMFIMDKFNRPWHVSNLFKTYDSDLNAQIMIITLVDLYTTNKLSPRDRIDMSRDRYIFVIPLQYFTFSTVSNGKNQTLDNYAPNKFGVNTQFIKEVMTIEGDMSCKDQLVLYNDDSINPFTITYDKNIYNLNDQIRLSTTKCKVLTNLDVDGSVTAKSYFTNSDARLKNILQDCNPNEDLQCIENVHVKLFNLKGTNDNVQKGVIAQEIETILPQCVTEKNGLIPNIQKKGKIIEDGKTISVLVYDGLVLTDVVRENEVLRIKCNNLETNKDVSVCSVTYNGENEYIIRIKESLELFSTVFIYGVYGNHKIVDHSYLFMTCINAVKALSIELKAIKNSLGLLD